jgi:hypothetical protein
MASNHFQTPLRRPISRNLPPLRQKRSISEIIPFEGIPLMPNLDDIPLTPPPMIIRQSLRPLKRHREENNDERRELKRVLF